MKVKYLIIGAGPTALGAAFRLQDLGEEDYLLIERSPWVGGLAASFKDDQGFTWDIGGHVQFSHYKYFDHAMEVALPKEEWPEHERESWVWIKDRFVPYPFQYHVRFLPRDSMWKCVQGVLALSGDQRDQSPPGNFEEWILRTFGQGIADEFLLPYNFKVWATPPKEMSYQWVGERVAVVDSQRLIENILFEKDDVSWGPNNTFKFPLHGGTGAIWTSLGKFVGGEKKIRLGVSLRSVFPQRKRAILQDGSEIEYDYLLSTIPVDHLTKAVANVPSDMVRSAGRLLHSTSHIVGIGLEGAPPKEIGTKWWMYFPESDCPFYRVTVFSNYSPNNVPDIKTQYSLMCETSESEFKFVNSETIVEETIQGLRNTRLRNETDRIVSKWHYAAPYGYPVPSRERDQLLAHIIPQLDERDVFSRGRFGGWKYEVSNQDHSFMQGVEWVNYVVNGEAETTFQVPRLSESKVSRTDVRIRANGAHRPNANVANS